ncbi:hypothetical protein ACFUGD_02715 [Streptomyces sp. NPDC057217]|uniref:hypothetical protein n=1 Tax=Streptomyces sp. NPDC057217 TaxID=3346054 RepID=UPI00362F39AC
MPERTQSAQQDEALRRVRSGCPVRATLRDIATTLRTTEPSGPFSEADRLTTALNAANGCTHRQAALLKRMPRIDWDTTRGEYGLILDRASWSA